MLHKRLIIGVIGLVTLLGSAGIASERFELDFSAAKIVFEETFDTELHGWSFSSKTPFVRNVDSDSEGSYDTPGSIDGNGSLRIDTKTSNSGGWWALSGVRPRGWRDYLIPGEEYTLIFWLRTEGIHEYLGGGGVTVWIKWNDDTNLLVRQYHTGGEWHQIAIGLKVPEEATHISGLYLRFEKTIGTAWFDDVRIYRGRLHRKVGLGRPVCIDVLDDETMQ